MRKLKLIAVAAVAALAANADAAKKVMYRDALGRDGKRNCDLLIRCGGPLLCRGDPQAA